MRKILYTMLALVILMSSLSGCSQLTGKMNKEEVKLYYGNLDNSKVEWILRPIEFSKESEKYENTLKALLNGPYSSDMQRNINENTKIISVIKKDGVIAIDFSKEFLSSPGEISQVISVSSITSTMTQFKGISHVDITVEGKPLLSPEGKPYGELGKPDVEKEKKVSIKIYMPTKEYDKMQAVSKEITLKEGEKLGKKIVEELILEAQSEKQSFIPRGTKVLGYEENKGTAFVNLSKEFIKNHPGGSAEETMSIYTIVNSLTEMKNVTGVQFLIEGEKKEEFISYGLDKPFERDEKVINIVE